jgi:hypothetical protein
VQAEQNRILLHSLINQSQSNQQQHASSARPRPTLDLLQNLERGATSFWDDLEQNRQSRATLVSNEQIFRDNIAFLNSSMSSSSSQPPHANVGGVSYGGPLSSLATDDDSNSPIIRFLKSQIITPSASDKSYTDSSNNSTVAAGNLQTIFAANPLALRNQLWGPT